MEEKIIWWKVKLQLFQEIPINDNNKTKYSNSAFLLTKMIYYIFIKYSIFLLSFAVYVFKNFPYI
jgi:hypothetical protein